MNLRQLEYWLAVIDEGSFTRAARRLHVAQPSLSYQIRTLESELGVRLIERLPRSIRLTPAGKAFLSEARAAVLSAERAAQAARAAMSLQAGELEIATVRSIAVGILPPAIRLWHDRHGGVTIRLREYVHRDLLEENVRSGVGDIAIGPRPYEWNGPLASLGFEEFVVVLPPNDPLGQADGRLALEKLAQHEWVLFPPHHGLSRLIATACGRAGFHPRESVRTEQVQAAARLAASGLGPALLPDNMVPADINAPVRRLEPPIVRELCAYTRNEWSSASRSFLDTLHSLDWHRRPPGAIVIP